MNSVSNLAAIARLATAGGLGFVVGWERQVRGHKAGDRTFALVCLGAAAFTLAAIPFPADAGKVIAGIATGVGFIGGGLLFQRSRHGDVHELTTAGALWAMVGVGVLAGIGRYLVALVASILVLLILELRYLPVLDMLDARRVTNRRQDSDPPRGRGAPPA